MVRGDGVVCSADEGGATVVRSKKRRRWMQPVHITIRRSGGTHTKTLLDQIRVAPEPESCHPKQAPHAQAYKGIQTQGTGMQTK